EGHRVWNSHARHSFSLHQICAASDWSSEEPCGCRTRSSSLQTVRWANGRMHMDRKRRDRERLHGFVHNKAGYLQRSWQ
ncbi:unnamed protein product, partial [Brassica rapa subsp. narinosa]